MPIYSDTQATSSDQTAIKFAQKFNLGYLEARYISGSTHLGGTKPTSVAYKFSKRPGLYRIHWNNGQERYDIYWMCAPDKQ